jgi:hypothetical protein
MWLFQPAIIIRFTAPEEWCRISQKGRQVYDNDCFTSVPPAFKGGQARVPAVSQTDVKARFAIPLLFLALHVAKYDYVATLIFVLFVILLVFLPSFYSHIICLFI